MDKPLKDRLEEIFDGQGFESPRTLTMSPKAIAFLLGCTWLAGEAVSGRTMSNAFMARLDAMVQDIEPELEKLFPEEPGAALLVQFFSGVPEIEDLLLKEDAHG